MEIIKFLLANKWMLLLKLTWVTIMNRTSFWSISLLNALLSGCTLAPHYKGAPEVEVPCEWHSVNTQDCSYAGSPGCFLWWEALNDPLLNSLIECAATQNLDLSIATMRILEARAERKGKEAALYPHIDGSISPGYFHCNRRALLDDLTCFSHHKQKCSKNVNIGFFEAGFDANWEIDLFGARIYEKNALDARIASLQENFYHIEISLYAEIGRNYIELRGLQQRLQVVEQEIEIQKETIHLIQELANIGLVDGMDILQAEAQLNIILAQKPLIEREIDKIIHRLSILIGRPPSELFNELIKPGCLPFIPDDKPLGIPSELLRRRPDIRKAERDLAAATETVGVAVAALFPRLSLKGFVGEITSHLHSIANPSSGVLFASPQLLVPIFNSKMIMQDVKYNKLKVQEAFYEYQKTVLLALEESENAISAFNHELERNQDLMRAQQLSWEAYNEALQLYERGFKSYLEVLTVVRSILSSEDTYIQSQVSLLSEYISIYKALGGGWDEQCNCER
jgi:multidrug efflux system outer membrane protein